MTIQRQVGGSMAGIFDMVAETVRNRQQFARKISSLTAMGRASAYVLVGVPFFMLGTITLLSAEYMAPLYHTSTGHKLLIGGLRDDRSVRSCSGKSSPSKVDHMQTLLLLAVLMLAGAAYLVGEVVTLPGRERQRAVRRAADLRPLASGEHRARAASASASASSCPPRPRSPASP